jgi:predicted aspartyl protease
MGCGAASALFAPLPLWAQDAAKPANGGNDKNNVAAATDTQQHLTVQVMINGKGPFDFVVDTGADRTVIADDVATALGMSLGKQVNVEGVVRTIPAQTVRLESISVGPVERNDLVVPVLPRALLWASGYLGLDVIDGYRVTLDFKNHELRVSTPAPRYFILYSPLNQTRISAFGRSGHLRAVNCRVDGAVTTAFLDTGAEVSAGNAKLLEAMLARDPSCLSQLTVPLSGVTGGLIQGRVASVRDIRFGPLVFSTCEIVIADLQIFDIWDLSDTPALLIGMNFLRQFNQVSIDYGRKELGFDLASLLVARNG